MAWLDKIRKFFAEEKTQDKDSSASDEEIIGFEQLYLKIKEKSLESLNKKEQLKKEIQARIVLLDKELGEAISMLEKIDLSDKREHEKVKLVVKENLNLYVSYLKRLLEKLNAINEAEIKDYMEKVYAALNEFNRASPIPYEKANILIGKELAHSRELVRGFIANMDQVSNNKELSKEDEIHKLDSLIKELKNSEIQSHKFDNDIGAMNSKISKTNKEIEETKIKIEDIKKSREFRDDNIKKEERNKNELELEKEIQNIKQKIELRELAKFYHTDKKKSKLIGQYGENFKLALENDKVLEIVKLVKEARNVELDIDFGNVQEKIAKLKEPLMTESDKEIKRFEESLKRLEYEIISLQESIKQESKKKEKLTVKKDEIISQIKTLSKSLLGVEVKV